MCPKDLVLPEDCFPLSVLSVLHRVGFSMFPARPCAALREGKLTHPHCYSLIEMRNQPLKGAAVSPHSGDSRVGKEHQEALHINVKTKPSTLLLSVMNLGLDGLGSAVSVQFIPFSTGVLLLFQP